jgi:hypothetical protein
MAITVTTGGTFIHADGDRPGLYVRFMQRAIAAISTGARSKVATIKNTYSGTATANKVYRVKSVTEADVLFGAANTGDISLMFQGGASEVVVVTATAGATTTADFNAALQILETYEFHVFVCPVIAVLEGAVYTWLSTNRTNGKNFIVVFANGAVETTEAIGTKYNTLKDEYSIFVANGVTDAEGNNVTAEKYAAYIGGLVAGTPLDGSLTYAEVPFSGVITRFRATEIQTLLSYGVLVTVMDGDQPMIQQGLCLGEAPFNKIRTVRAKQSMIDDIDKAVNDNYIGKITNDQEGQIAVINAIKVYLQTLSDANVIDENYTVALDKLTAAGASELYINISVKFLDSIEYIYLTISL